MDFAKSGMRVFTNLLSWCAHRLVQVDVSAGDDRVSSLSDLALKVDSVAVLAVQPHVGLDGLTRRDWLGKSDLDALEVLNLTIAELVEYVLHSDTERAESVKDRLVEAENSTERWIDVQGVEITVETVQSSLVDSGLLFHRGVWLAVEFLGRVGFDDLVRIAFAAETATSDCERDELVQGDLFVVLVVQLD